MSQAFPYHTSPGSVVYTTTPPWTQPFLNLTTLDTVDTTPLLFFKYGMVSSPIQPSRIAYILKPNIKAGASVIHIIDRFLFPYYPWVINNASASAL